MLTAVLAVEVWAADGRASAEPVEAKSAKSVGLSILEPTHSPIATQDLIQVMESALAQRGHRVIANPIELARLQIDRGAVLADRLLPFARSEALAAEGWRAYAVVDNQTARARLEAATAAALAVADLSGGVELLAEITLRLGVVLFELGEAKTSAANFRLAYRLAPDRAVTDNEFKPAVVTAFRAAVAAPTVRRAIAVSLEPSIAAVEIDGTTRVAAGESLDLEVGLHLVVIRAPSMNAESKLVDVPAAGAMRIHASLVRDSESAALYRLQSTKMLQIQPRVGMTSNNATAVLEASSLFAELDAMFVVAAIWQGRELALIGQRCMGIPLHCGALAEVRFADQEAVSVAATELVNRLENLMIVDSEVTITTDSRIRSSVTPPPIVVHSPSKPWWKNRWLWLGVGAAAATTTAAIWLIRDPTRDVVIIVDPCQFGQCP